MPALTIVYITNIQSDCDPELSAQGAEAVILGKYDRSKLDVQDADKIARILARLSNRVHRTIWRFRASASTRSRESGKASGR
jgi:hypothetical protein